MGDSRLRKKLLFARAGFKPLNHSAADTAALKALRHPKPECFSVVTPEVKLKSQHATGFDGQDVQGAFKLGDGFGEFGVLPDSLSQGVQELAGTRKMFYGRCVFRTWLWLRCALCRHVETSGSPCPCGSDILVWLRTETPVKLRRLTTFSFPVLRARSLGPMGLRDDVELN